MNTALSPRIDGETLLFATPGDPVAQVRLPQVMQAVFATLNLNAIWVPMQVDEPAYRDVLCSIGRIRNFRGITVAIPYKPPTLGWVDRRSQAAEAAGAVNLVRRDPDGALHGDMADGEGFVRGLARRGHAVRGASVWLVGVGGGGSAIAAALGAAGAARLCLGEAIPERARLVQERLVRNFPAMRIEIVAPGTPPGEVDFAINATPLGLRVDDPLPFDPARLGARTVVCDIVMKPKETGLLRAAVRHGLAVHHGHHMLDAQIPLYLDFFGLPCPDEAAVIAAASRA